METDTSLATNPTLLQDKIRQLFSLVRACLAAELNAGSDPPSPAGDSGHPKSRNGDSAAPALPLATSGQVRALFAITKSRQLDLKRLLHERFQVNRPNDLNIKQASNLIDELNQLMPSCLSRQQRSLRSILS